jgi:misacylated tRNA(Ala) deacylase
MKFLYLDDCYLKNFDSVVEETNERFVKLRETAFYPNSGGQPNDTGKITKEDGGVYRVINALKEGSAIVHELDKAGLAAGDKIHGVIDWDRRHKLMRMHTASHLLSAVINKESGALITGNQLGIDKSRIDFNLEKFERERFYEYCQMTNELIGKEIPVKIYFLEKQEISKLPTLLAKGLPPNLEKIRIVEIEGVDMQADGGTHVKNLREIGKIETLKLENKGKNNRRIYFKLV